MRLVLLLCLAGCADEPRENPQVVSEVTSSCGATKRLVRDVCTKLGSDDSCVDVDDVCVALCDSRSACTTVGGLRILNGWPTAPDGYCVECTTP